MLIFHLSSRSGIPAYSQLVEQVRQALLSGVLRPGDRLPTVKEVAGALAVNPNTVSKAYRDLEQEGLVEGRQGVGTFAVRRPAGPPPGVQAQLSRSMAAWIAKARLAGLNDSDIESLLRATLRADRRGGDRVTAAVHIEGLGKRYGKKWALQDGTFDIPEGSVTGLVGANGAGKTTLLRLLAGLSRPTTGSALVAGRTPADEVAFLADVGYLAQEIPLYARWDAADHLRMGAALNPRWDQEVASAAAAVSCASRWTRRSARCRVASAPRWRWPWRWASGRRSCCSTSRLQRWTRWPAETSWAR